MIKVYNVEERNAVTSTVLCWVQTPDGWDGYQVGDIWPGPGPAPWEPDFFSGMQEPAE